MAYSTVVVAHSVVVAQYPMEDAELLRREDRHRIMLLASGRSRPAAKDEPIPPRCAYILLTVYCLLLRERRPDTAEVRIYTAYCVLLLLLHVLLLLLLTY